MAFVERAQSFSRQVFAARKEAFSALGADYVVYLAAAGMVLVLPFLFIWQSPPEFWDEGRWAFVGSLGIFLFFSFLGLFVAFKTMIAHNREFRVAAMIFAKVKSDLAKLDGDEEALRPSDIGPSHYVPEGERDTACAKLVEKHFDTARALRSDDGIAALVIANDLNVGRGTLRTLSAFALRVGILLTFFGLLVGLAPIGSALETTEDLAEVPIGELLSGLTISFTSSIAGLSAALVIGVLLQATDRSFTRLKVSIDDLALALRQVYSKVRFGGDISKTVDHLTEEMRTHAREMESHGVQVEKAVDQASRAFREHAEESGRIMSSVARSTDDLIALDREHKGAISKISQTISALGQFETKWTEHVDNLVNKTSASLREHGDTLTASFTSNFDALQDKITEQQKSGRDEVKVAVNSIASITQTVSDTLASVSANQDSKDSKISDSLLLLDKSINQLTNSVVDREDKSSEFANALIELDSSIKEIGYRAREKRSNWKFLVIIIIFMALGIYMGWPSVKNLITPIIPFEFLEMLDSA